MAFRRILIANRGEISLRIQRTCRELGIETVAVFSEVDAAWPFVAFADHAICIGQDAARDTYLDAAKILDAARRTQCDAIHPGYGFLSENPVFAEACEKEFAFIGPRAETLRLFGDKVEAKRAAKAAGVPILDGDLLATEDADALARAARSTGWPVLLKAAAGGGGRGMRIARNEGELLDAIPAARREALAAFGDGRLLLERFLPEARHVEVQILGDGRGKVVHLFDRDCSVQRRHQKLIEEAPAPGLSAPTRQGLADAALAIARSANYRSAGTVEFLVEPSGAFFFIELNPRLQVEHRVTELVTGVDLVREQIAIAEGAPLGLDPSSLRCEGVAIEARVCAEDPAAGFLPTTGTVLHVEAPSESGVLVDAGVAPGSVAGTYYDSLIAKVIAHAPSRELACRKLGAALGRLGILGVATNAAFLQRVLEHAEFRAGALRTAFLAAHEAALTVREGDDVLRLCALGATLASVEACRATREHRSIPAGFRNAGATLTTVQYDAQGRSLSVAYRELVPGSFLFIEGDAQVGVRLRAAAVLAPGVVRVEVSKDDHLYALCVARDGASWSVHGRAIGTVTLVEAPRFGDVIVRRSEDACVAPVPGRIVSVRVQEGQSVRTGDVVVTLEAMKTEFSITAPHDGIVKGVLVAPGRQVSARDVLVSLAHEEPQASA